MALITNLSVPTGASDTPTPTLMPKLQYRFRVSFDYDDNRLVTSNVMSVTRPTFTHDEMQLDTYNSRIYLAGKHTWEPVTIVMRDDVSNNVQNQLEAQLEKQINMTNQSAPVAGASYKFKTTIETLDGGNADAGVLDTWTLAGCYIQNIAYGESNYATSDAQQITVTLRYDNAIHEATTSPGGNASSEGTQA